MEGCTFCKKCGFWIVKAKPENAHKNPSGLGTMLELTVQTLKANVKTDGSWKCEFCAKLLLENISIFSSAPLPHQGGA